MSDEKFQDSVVGEDFRTCYFVFVAHIASIKCKILVSNKIGGSFITKRIRYYLLD